MHSMLLMSISRVLSALAVICLTGCQSTELDTALKNVVTIKYDHVANVQEVRFRNPVQLDPGLTSVVQPAEDGAFWAVFAICSIEPVQAFDYDVANFSVEYRGTTYGHAIPASTLLYQAYGGRWPAPGNVSLINDAMRSELETGPVRQRFPPGLYFPGYRIAVLIAIPSTVPSDRRDQLTLKYGGHPSIVQGGGKPPSDIPILGMAFGVLPNGCR